MRLFLSPAVAVASKNCSRGTFLGRVSRRAREDKTMQVFLSSEAKTKSNGDLMFSEVHR